MVWPSDAYKQICLSDTRNEQDFLATIRMDTLPRHLRQCLEVPGRQYHCYRRYYPFDTPLSESLLSRILHLYRKFTNPTHHLHPQIPLTSPATRHSTQRTLARTKQLLEYAKGFVFLH